MKKGILAIAGLAAIAIIAKKAQKRKAFVRGIFDEYDVKERTPFGFADRIRTMNDEEYNSLKESENAIRKRLLQAKICRIIF
jgi:hypothetical protein